MELQHQDAFSSVYYCDTSNCGEVYEVPQQQLLPQVDDPNGQHQPQQQQQVQSSTDSFDSSKWFLENLANEYKSGFESLKAMLPFCRTKLSTGQMDHFEYELAVVEANLVQLDAQYQSLESEYFKASAPALPTLPQEHQHPPCEFTNNDALTSNSLSSLDGSINFHSLDPAYHLPQVDQGNLLANTSFTNTTTTYELSTLTDVVATSDLLFSDLPINCEESHYQQEQHPSSISISSSSSSFSSIDYLLSSVDDESDEFFEFMKSEDGLGISVSSKSDEENLDHHQQPFLCLEDQAVSDPSVDDTCKTEKSGNKSKSSRHSTGKGPTSQLKKCRPPNECRIWYRCAWEGCSFGSYYNGVVKRHSMKRHSGKMKIDKSHNSSMHRFKCDWPGCEVSLVAYHKLVEHKRKHTGEKPFRCKLKSCNYATARLYSMIIHERTHKLDLFAE